MTAAVFLRALKDRWPTMLALATGLALFLGMVAWWYPEYRAQAEVSMKLLPSFIKKMMGARVSMARPEGYVSWVLIHPLSLAMLATWAIGIPSAAIAGAIERGTLAFTLSGPITRGRFILAQIGILVLGQAVTVAACVGAVAGMLAWHGVNLPGGSVGWLLAALQALLLMMGFGGITMLISSATSESANAFRPAIAIMMVALFVSLFGDVFRALEPLKPLSPFTWFRPYEPLAGKETAWTAWLCLAGLPLATLIGAWQVFRRRNLSI